MGHAACARVRAGRVTACTTPLPKASIRAKGETQTEGKTRSQVLSDVPRQRC